VYAMEDSAEAENERFSKLLHVPPRLHLATAAKWAPVDMVDWMSKVEGSLSAASWETNMLLITDERMRSVWDWHSLTCQRVKRELHRTSSSLALSIERAMMFPSKPGNMTKKKREEYFRKVRMHAIALQTLIQDTRFSSNSAGWSGMESTPIDPDELTDVVVKDLQSWGHGDDDQGHVVAYLVTSDEVSRLPWTFPESHLYDQLEDLLEWTSWDDNWGNLLVSSAPISHANTSNARTIFFTCTLFQSLAGKGANIPFTHLATLANVVLKLPITDQVDEDTVRKQVRRYQERWKSDADLINDAF